MAMAAPPHAPMAAAAASANVSITCSSSSSSYEDDECATSSWSLSSPHRRPYRRLLHDEAQRLRRARRSQGPGADTPRWVRRTTDQMSRYVEDDRAGHVYGRHVVAAVRAVRATASRPSADMHLAMASFVTKLTFREMCVVLREQRGWRQARDFFAWMKLQMCYEPSVVAYTILLRLYGRVGKIKLAEETFLEMLEVGCEPDAVACGTLLCAYARWGRHKDMMLFYSAVRRRDIVPPISVYNYMISSLQKQKLHGKVIQVWKQMLEAGVLPTQFTYTVVISSYVKEDLLEEAMDIFGEMRRYRFVPEEATYSHLISLSSKHGRGEQALRLFEEMRAQGIVPSNYTCASLLALYYKNEDYSKALALFSEMENNKIVPDEVIYGILIRIYGKLRLYEDAQHTFAEIEKADLLSDEQTYVAMAQVHMNVGHYDRALEVLESMRTRNVKPSHFSYSALLRCYVAMEDMAAAEDSFRALSKYGLPDAFCCNDLLRLYIRLGHLEKARALVLKMRQDDFQLDDDLYMTVMDLYCKSSMLVDSEKLFKEIRRSGKPMKIPTMLSLIEMYARNRTRGIQKEQSLSKAIDETDSSAAGMALKFLLDMPGGLSSVSQLLSKLAREGNTDEAKFIYDQLTEMGIKPDGSAIATLIVQYGQAKQLEQAKELFESASTSFPGGAHVYDAMVDAFCKCGKAEDAYHLFMEMAVQGNNRDPVTVSILVTHLTKHGKFQEVENIIHSCFRDEVQLDTVLYNTFIKSMLESGKLHSAVSIYDRMISAGISRSMQTFNIMISVYGKGGKLDKAVEMFDAAQELGLPIDEKIYTNMLSLYGKAGQVGIRRHLYCSKE
ncbi:pentatricopeptide repeat-containing protein At5g27270 isoform X2 [Panicum hallii]|uniref:pentatricopeptide repeat-containing protein At5g27270 isoform X2 n=1 Tax=Panicum hallii TaxID=206008 RepID=UPI000DF4D98D|nr:pentatricopeptide repeat-containing protein At5g27270 isoform X2 [Panicum hallii]